MRADNSNPQHTASMVHAWLSTGSTPAGPAFSTSSTDSSVVAGCKGDCSQTALAHHHNKAGGFDAPVGAPYNRRALPQNGGHH